MGNGFQTISAGNRGLAVARAEYLGDRHSRTVERGRIGEYEARGLEQGEHLGAEVQMRPDLSERVVRALGLSLNTEPSMELIANLLYGGRADGGTLPGQNLRDVSAIDLVFSPDKSVDLAYAAAPTSAEREIIRRAHDTAVDRTMAYVEQEIGRARRGKGGRGGSEPGETFWTKFTHFTARPTVEVVRKDAQGKDWTDILRLNTSSDPDLHTHVALLNLVFTRNRVGSLDTKKLPYRMAEFRRYYNAHLATELRKSGADVRVDRRTGAARLTAIPDHVRDSYSKRNRDGVDSARRYAAARGMDWDTLGGDEKARLINRSIMDARQTKQNGGALDMAALEKQARALNWRHRSVFNAAKAQGPAVDHAQRHEMAYRAAMPLVSDAFRRRAVITGADLRVIAAAAHIDTGIMEPGDIDAVTRMLRERGIVQDGVPTRLFFATENNARNAYSPDKTTVSTELHERQELELVGLARRANADRSGALAPVRLTDAIAKSAFSFDAERMEVLDRFAHGGQFEVAIGVAGAGKGTLLQPLVDAWKQDGRNVHAAALSWQATEELAGAGIESRAAIAKFLTPYYQRRAKLDRNSVVVIDEIGQVGTRVMLSLLRLQEEKGFKLVALGDPQQCQPLEAGQLIPLMRRALGKDLVPEITQTMRQVRGSDEERVAILLRNGNAAEALDIKRANGSLKLVEGSYKQAVDAVAVLWRERMEANKHDPKFRLTISAPSNEEARDIGAAIRAVRQQSGEVEQAAYTLKARDQNHDMYDLPLSRGDRVRVFHRLHAKGSKTGGAFSANGSVLEVREVGPEGIVLRHEKGREARFSWDDLRQKDEQRRPVGRPMLAYGYALTIDTSQGLTSTEHIDAMPRGTRTVNGFKAYVAESRQRVQSWMVVSAGAERREMYEKLPQRSGYMIREPNILENMARNLSRQPTKLGSLEFRDRARNLRYGAMASALEAIRPGQSRLAEGLSRATLHVRLARGRAQRALAAAFERTPGLGLVRESVDIGRGLKAAVSRKVGIARQHPVGRRLGL